MDSYDPMSRSYGSIYTSVGSPDGVPNQLNSEFFDNFLVFDDDWMNEESQLAHVAPREYADYTPEYASSGIEEDRSQSIGSSSIHLQGNCNGATEIVHNQKLTKKKVAFKTKSQVEILDDGFKWRKYGKKMVKNSPNPRNYYRCSAEGCSVKKRVERDVEDVRYVITTYEGVHNHQRPSNF